MKNEGCDDLIREIHGSLAFSRSGRGAEAKDAPDTTD
jgi:hypothetical protein